MKWLFKVLTSRGFLAVFGLVVIATLVVLLGLALGWSLVVTGLVLAVLLLVIGLVVLLVRMRATKAASSGRGRSTRFVRWAWEYWPTLATTPIASSSGSSSRIVPSACPALRWTCS